MLAKACDVEKAHLYYYFKNKQDLMLEVLRYLKQRAEDEIFLPAFDESKEYSILLEEVLIVLISPDHQFGNVTKNLHYHIFVSVR